VKNAALFESEYRVIAWSFETILSKSSLIKILHYKCKEVAPQYLKLHKK